MISKLLIKIISFLRKILPLNVTINHKYLNKHQVTNLEIVMNSLKNRGYLPNNIYDIGCFHGLWTKKVLKIFKQSNFFLFDADISNEEILVKIKNKFPNVSYKIKLLSDEIKEYKFFKMQSGSSIFEEQTTHPREIIKLKSSTLSSELNEELKNSKNNLIKIDAQGSEIKILKGLENNINFFEIIILEVSLHEYNKNGPLFDEVTNFMSLKGFKIYDIYDLKRLGLNKSFLLQFDCIFIRKDSDLLNVKF
tara:strand:- start:226 stop:975 length:750 start_codon:yes stop_codon:yes gene_type:complete